MGGNLRENAHQRVRIPFLRPALGGSSRTVTGPCLKLCVELEQVLGISEEDSFKNDESEEIQASSAVSKTVPDRCNREGQLSTNPFHYIKNIVQSLPMSRFGESKSRYKYQIQSS